MRNVLLAVIVIAVGTSCASSHGGGGGAVSTGDPHVKPVRIKLEKGKEDLPRTIYIDASTDQTVFFPREIELYTRKTDLIWVAFGASNFSVTYKYKGIDPTDQAELDDAKAPCQAVHDSNGNEVGWSCVLLKNRHKKHGEIDYAVELTPKSGSAVSIDPRLIIQP